jgi:hypothetical protein
VLVDSSREEEEEFDGADGKDPAAQSMGRKGGKARAERLSARKRSEIASKAARKRWRNKAGIETEYFLLILKKDGAYSPQQPPERARRCPILSRQSLRPR